MASHDVRSITPTRTTSNQVCHDEDWETILRRHVQPVYSGRRKSNNAQCERAAWRAAYQELGWSLPESLKEPQ